MTRANLRRMIGIGAGAALLFTAGCGSDATTPTKTTPAKRTRTTSANDQGGAQVTAGPGSASVSSAAATGAPGAAGIAAVTTADSALRPFAQDSPWNTSVAGQPIDRRSATWIRLAQRRIGVEEKGSAPPRQVPRTITDGIFINTTRWTTPIVDETNGIPTRVVCRQLIIYCGDGQSVSALTVPATEDPLPQYDGWFTVLNRGEGVAYDMWRARRAPGTNVISYQFMRKWDLNGPGFQEPNTVAARGSGLPLFAGVILPQEIRSGRIEHALAISLPGPAQRRYVQPASATDGNGALTSIPEGARIRLKASAALTFRSCPRRTAAEIRANPQPPSRCMPDRTSRRAATAIFRALRTYGAIVVDRSRVPTLYAKLNADWTSPLRDSSGRLLDASGRLLNRFVRKLRNQGTPLLRGSEVQQLKVSDFEVVTARGALLSFPPTTTSAALPATQTSTAGIP